jgi:hypothetical protein
MISLQAPSQIISTDEVLRVVREGCVRYVDGKPLKDKIKEFEIACNVQPLGGKDLLLVPEGDRTKEQYWLWTPTAVEINDRVIRRELSFQIQTVEVWGSYAKARIMRIDVGEYS